MHKPMTLKSMSVSEPMGSILVGNAANPVADITKRVAEIDKLVHRLYGLKDKENSILTGKQ